MSIQLAFVSFRAFVIVSIILSIMLMCPMSGLIGLNCSANTVYLGVTAWRNSTVVRNDGLMASSLKVFQSCIFLIYFQNGYLSFIMSIQQDKYLPVKACLHVWSMCVLCVKSSNICCKLNSIEQSQLNATLGHWRFTQSSVTVTSSPHQS